MSEMNNLTEIIDYGYDGEGVGKLDGKICFIPYTIKGEKVLFDIVKTTKSYCQGRLKDIVIKSSIRQRATCKYFGECGGCRYQHLPYEEELKIKTYILQKQLSKIGYTGAIKIISSDRPYGYRNKLKLFVENNKIGLKRLASNQICEISECKICNKLISNAILIIKDFLKTNDLFNEIYQIIFRQEEKCCLINFYVYHYNKIDYSSLQKALGDSYGIFQTYNNRTIHICGLKSLDIVEFGLQCKFSPNSFHQVNDSVCKKLYATALKYVKGSVLNCYSGNGVLSGIIAKNTKQKVVGIELGKSEHIEAERLKEENNLVNLSNIKGNCDSVIKRIKQSFDTIIVDPPRNGMSKIMCNELSKMNISNLIYISCNCATFVRDYQRLKNFKLKTVFLYDMFARTGEYEILSILEKC